MKPHSVLCADPPWPFEDALPGKTRGARRQYKLMAIADICRFPLPPMRDDAILFMWRVSAMVPEAYEVVKAWGFEHKSEIVWQKMTTHGKKHFGLGHTVRASHESVIIAVRGKPKLKLRNVRSTFSAPTPRDEKGKIIHSAKPEAFYDLVEELAAGPYAELFARRQRPGWSCFGNQLPPVTPVVQKRTSPPQSAKG